jgi:hypothetical protein
MHLFATRAIERLLALALLFMPGQVFAQLRVRTISGIEVTPRSLDRSAACWPGLAR